MHVFVKIDGFHAIMIERNAIPKKIQDLIEKYTAKLIETETLALFPKKLMKIYDRQIIHLKTYLKIPKEYLIENYAPGFDRNYFYFVDVNNENNFFN